MNPVRWTASLLTLGILLPAQVAMGAAPTPAQILQFKPRQEGVLPGMPKSGEENACKVELVKGQGKGSGWILRDPSGQVLRRFFDTNDDNKIDVWSYFRDGQEVYRELDTNLNALPDQFRWVNAGGARWGVDVNEDGTIDGWQMLSPEEASQELVRAVATNNINRFRALLLTDADLKQMDLAGETGRQLKEKVATAPTRFLAAVAKLEGAKPSWLHLELGTPQCLPTDATGSRFDLIRHPRGTILMDLGGKTEWLQSGEMVQVGAAWKLVEGPAVGAISEDEGSRLAGRLDLDKDPELKKMVDELTAIDKDPAANGTPAEISKHHLRRADQLEKIVARMKPEDRESWIHQVADSLAGAAQVGKDADPAGLQRLASLAEQLNKATPGGNVAAYVVFRHLQAEYSQKLAKPGEDFGKVQLDWIARLTQFVTSYPKSDETVEALLQLGMVSEFLGKETEARNWYGQAAKNFGDKPQGIKAAGAVRRLDSEGQLLRIAAAPLANPQGAYDLTQATGKVVLVYFWASWNNQSIGDFAKIKALLETHGAKGLELVAINCDQTTAEAQSVVQRAGVGGVHLHQPGGLDGKLCTEQGLMVLPHVFLVGQDGKVINKNAQLATIEDDIRRQVK